MKLIKKITAALLAMLISVSVAACGENTAYIANVSGVDVKAGVYIYYQMQGYMNGFYQLYYSGEQFDDIMDAKIDGVKFEKYVNDYATEQYINMVAVQKEFERLGLTISDEDAKKISVKVEQDWSQSSVSYTKNGIGKGSIEDIYTASFMSEKLFEKYYEVGGIEDTKEEDIKTYLAENYARIKYIAFSLKDGENKALDDEGKEEVYNLAKDYLAKAEAGYDFNQLIEDYKEWFKNKYPSEEDLPSLKPGADDEEEDTEEEEEETEEEEEVDPYLNEKIVNKEGTSPTEKFIKNVFEEAKTVGFYIFKDDDYYFLVQKMDILERDDLYEEYRDSLLGELFQDEYTELLQGLVEKLDVKKNDKAYNRYDVDNLEF